MGWPDCKDLEGKKFKEISEIYVICQRILIKYVKRERKCPNFEEEVLWSRIDTCFTLNLIDRLSF